MVRLIISEGPRFPALAEFYYREVLSRILEAARAMLRRAVERGELPDDTLVRFPQLLGAPAVIAIVWSGLFDRFEPLDVRSMLRAYFHALFAEGRVVMNALAASLSLSSSRFCLAAATTRQTVYQGWIEADLIFVAPDEIGRVQTLSVREGDTVKKGEPLFTVDDDLQQADLAQVKAALVNAQQTFDRASMLAKTGAGTQKDLDAATATLRDAQARLNSSQTRLVAPPGFQPGQRHGAAGLLPARRDGAGEPSGARHPAARQSQGALLHPRAGAAERRLWRQDQGRLRRLRQGSHGADQLTSPSNRNSRRR